MYTHFTYMAIINTLSVYFTGMLKGIIKWDEGMDLRWGREGKWRT